MPGRVGFQTQSLNDEFWVLSDVIRASMVLLQDCFKNELEQKPLAVGASVLVFFGKYGFKWDDGRIHKVHRNHHFASRPFTSYRIALL